MNHEKSPDLIPTEKAGASSQSDPCRNVDACPFISRRTGIVSHHYKCLSLTIYSIIKNVQIYGLSS